MDSGKKANRLINEKSPYLQQHAFNPVDWFPWGDEAFEKAAAEHKPIFLSIGYSTCHWCHVMEHESFEDTSVAELLNKYFVAIKVDREERPDIDQIYMKVCQLVTGHGGWPLTIVMTPEKKPFFAGTYFPKNSRQGRIGMLELLPQLQDAWLNKQKEIYNSADYITNHLNEPASDEEIAELSEGIFDAAYSQFAERFDSEFGGFGSAPKFPSPHNLMYLLRYWNRTGEKKALEMVAKTLREMRSGGIFDQLGFGFHRYSTDRKWLVPHFEKMLYDQALLAMAYTETYQATGDVFFKRTADEILTYVLRDMTSPEGGFYSAEDADSEGEEGKFYTWTTDELKKISGDEFERLSKDFGVNEEGNYFDEATRSQNGRNILHLVNGVENFDFSAFEKTREKLFNIRERRIHPLKDRKILTDWNGLMIAAFAKAGRAFNVVKYIEAAERAANFIQNNLFDGGGLLHRSMEGEAQIAGMLDDYAFLVFALNELYEATYRAEYLQHAFELNMEMLKKFSDDDSTGFYFSRSGQEDLISRTKEYYDGAIPSGNSAAMLNIVRLAKYSADSKMEERARRLSRWFGNKISPHPTSASFFLSALEFNFGNSKELIISDGEDGKVTKEFLSQMRKDFYPEITTILIDEKNKAELEAKFPYLKNYHLEKGKTKFYICENFICNQPVETTEEALKLLK